MGKSKFLGPGYFYRIIYNLLGERSWLIANSTIMFLDTELVPTDEHVRKEAERKLSEIYDAKVIISHFYPIETETTFLV